MNINQRFDLAQQRAAQREKFEVSLRRASQSTAAKKQAAASQPAQPQPPAAQTQTSTAQPYKLTTAVSPAPKLTPFQKLLQNAWTEETGLRETAGQVQKYATNLAQNNPDDGGPDDPNLLGRLGLTAKGAGQSYAGSSINALSTLADYGILNNAWTEEQGLMDTAQQVQKAAVERRLAKTTDPTKSARLKTVLDGITNKPSTEEILNAPDPIRDAGHSLLTKAGESTAKAKQGASWLGRLGIDAATGAMQLAGDIGIGALTGGSAMIPMALRSFGGAAQEAEDAGASINQQVGYGALTAATSVLVERISSAGKIMSKAFGKGIADDVLEKGLSKFAGKIIKNQAIAGRLAAAVAGGAGEGLEEMIESSLSPLFQKLTYDPNAKFDADTVSDMLYDGLVGAIIGGVAGGVGGSNVQRTAQDTAKSSIETTPTAQDIAPQPTQAPTSAENVQGVKLPTETQEIAGGAVEPVTAIEPMAKPREQTGLHIDDRSYSDVSSRKVKAFQYDNPELHQHYVEAAKGLLGDLGQAQKGERWAIKDADGYFTGFSGAKRSVTPNIEVLLDHAKLSYAQIEKGLHDLIADNGQENYAAAKKIELILDDMLTNGYEVEGHQVEPDYEYIRKKEAIKSGEQSSDYSMTEDEWNALLNSEPSHSAPSIFPENSLGAKITQQKGQSQATPSKLAPNLPQGTGAASPEFAYQERVNQQHSTDTAFTEAERQMPGLRTEDSTHQVVTDKNAMAQAEQRLAFDFEGEKTDLATKQDWDKADTTTAHLILRKLTGDARKSGDYSEAVKWNKTLEKQKSAQGQALQANRQFANKPESIVADAAESLFSDKSRDISDKKKAAIMDKVSEAAETLDGISSGDSASVITLIKDLSTQRKTDGVFNKKMSGAMSGALDYFATQEGGFDFLKEIAAGQIRSVATDYNKTSFWRGVKSIRFANMLSSVATVMRNLVGNTLFDIGDSASNNLAVPFDMALSLVSGNRSVALDGSWFSEAKRNGSVDGFLKSFVQVGLDVDLDNVQSKYETTPGRTFKMTGNPVERFLSTVQKWQGYALQSTDEFAKGGTKAEAQRGIDKLKRRGKTSQDALQDRAMEIAKQRTFQNAGATARAVLGLRGAANTFSLKDSQGGSFGAGDLAVPFAQVPANLGAQAAKATPVGLATSLGRFADALVKAKQGKLTADQQADVVTDLGRGLTGTAGFALFAGLAMKGVLKVVGSDDKDKDALEGAQGQSGTQLNLDALVRWIKGGDTEWQSGDNLLNMGFAEHLNVQMAVGALVAEAYKEDESASLGDVARASVQGVFQSVLELPAISQIGELIDGYRYSKAEDVTGKLADSGGSYLGSQASSFIAPNLVAAVARGRDTKVRDTYSSDNAWVRAKDSLFSKIPGLRETLPVKLDPWGNERTTGDNSLLNFINATVLPGRVNQFQTSDLNKELFRLDGEDVDVKFPSRKMTKTLSYDDTDYELDQKASEQFHNKSHQLAQQYMSAVISEREYKQMSDGEKAKMLKDMQGLAIDTAKREYFTNRGIEYKSDYNKAFEAQQAGMKPSTYYHYKNALKKERPEGGTPSQLQFSKAINTLNNLSQKDKGKLWDIQNEEHSDKNPFTGELATMGMQSRDIIGATERYDALLENVTDETATAAGANKSEIRSSYIRQWLKNKGYTAEEIDIVISSLGFAKKISSESEAYVAANPR